MKKIIDLIKSLLFGNGSVAEKIQEVKQLETAVVEEVKEVKVKVVEVEKKVEDKVDQVKKTVKKATSSVKNPKQVKIKKTK